MCERLKDDRQESTRLRVSDPSTKPRRPRSKVSNAASEGLERGKGAEQCRAAFLHEHPLLIVLGVGHVVEHLGNGGVGLDRGQGDRRQVGLVGS